jgi:hypothetical protein
VLRAFLCFAAVAVFALPCRADQTLTPPETLIRLSVTPAPAPKPSLRYRLLPELKDMNPGNPIQHYMKCMLEQQNFFFDKEAYERREKLLAMPLKELPAQVLEDQYGRFALSQVDRAARLDNPDWQILLKLRADGIGTLLPEVQQMRSLARALQLRMRSEVAQGRFDDALRTARTLLAMARHLGEHPTFVGNLYGFVVANLAIGPLEEMLEQPGCPNLYWALTTLPNPLIPLDKGMDGERLTVLWVFRDLDESAPMSADQLKKFIAPLAELLEIGAAKSGTPAMRAWLDARTKDESKVSAARRRLVEHGLSEERLRRFPADQVILLDEKREWEVRFDNLIITMTLPTWLGEPLAAQTNKMYKEPALFADALVPATYAVRKAQVRLDQRIALLRQVEALRLYAADHKGTLPAKLSDVAVPLPDDPFTGKPFRYEKKGGTAHIRGSPPSGEEKNAHFNIHFEVTVQK